MSSENIVTVEMPDGTEKKGYVRKPNRALLSDADMYRAKVWSKCVFEEGLMTKSQIHKALEERGIWTKENQEEKEKLVQDIIDLEKDLYLANATRSIDEGKKLVMKIKEKRNELHLMTVQLLVMEENSADAIADNARMDYLAAHCIYNEDNTQPVFKDLDDYNANGDDDFAFKAAQRLAEIVYGFNRSGDDDLPENKWLKNFNLINDDGRFVNADGDLVDIDGRRINDKGHYIDKDGHRIDRDGNPLNEDGTYVLKTQYENEPKKRKGRSTKSTA